MEKQVTINKNKRALEAFNFQVDITLKKWETFTTITVFQV